MIRPALVAAIAGLLAGLLGVWAGLNLFAPPTPQAEPSLHEIVHAGITLSDEQEARIEVLEAEFSGERARLEAQLETARAAIGEALAQDHRMSPELEDAASRFHAAMSELQVASLNHILAMRAVLDPAQQEAFDRQLAQAFHGAE